jgi:nicotinate-nucleotide adenylyltransferase
VAAVADRSAGAHRVGIFGGAFDPPHVGHVALACTAVERFALDRLLVRVVEDPGHKDVATAPQIRLFLAELAFGPIDEAEVALDAHARTVDSLEALGLDDPWFLIGADEFAALPTWKSPERVLELARMGVATRPGVDHARLERVLDQLQRPERVAFFDIDPLPVSSSDIRARAAAGEAITGLVPPAVEAEIGRLGLYRAVRIPDAGGMLRDDPIEGTNPT